MNFLPCLASQGGRKLDDSSRLDVVEIALVPDMLPSFFPSWVGLRTYQHSGTVQNLMLTSAIIQNHRLRQKKNVQEIKLVLMSPYFKHPEVTTTFFISSDVDRRSNIQEVPRFLRKSQSNCRVIPEQSPGETNPLFQMAISTQSPHTTQTEQ